MDAQKKRKVWIDYLRSLGLLLVIGAHVFGTSTPILQLLFGCNVAIMIVVSGYCAFASSNCSVTEYYKKRGLQMIIHPWIFFVVYFLMIGFLNLGKPYPYATAQIIKTFLFMDGIGYTWIIAVFILIALSTPVIKYLLENVPNSQWIFPVIYWVVSIFLFAINAEHIVIKALLYVCGYIFLAYIGFSICINVKRMKVYLISGILVLICCITMMLLRQEDVFDLAGNKYPPSVYYTTYGMTISLTLLMLLSRLEEKLSTFYLSRVIVEVSKNSFDFYLWHIFGLYIATFVNNVWLKFVIVISMSSLCTIVYCKIRKLLLGTLNKNLRF